MSDWNQNPFAADIARIRRVPGVEAMLQEVCAMTGFGFAAVARVTDTHWVACQVLDRLEFGLDAGDELDIQTTICNEIRQSGQAVMIDDVAQDAEWRKHPVPALYGFKSYISLPIIRRDSFFGTLCALDPARSSVPLNAIYPRMREIAERIAAALDDDDDQARDFQATTLQT